MTGLLEAALSYAARGWPVFPLEPKDKRPLGRLVPHGLKQATTDLEVVERWWSAEPTANIALVTGVAFDVVDIDSLDGLVALVEHQADREMTPGPQVETAKGAHLYHRPTGLGNRAGILAGVDFRGLGGYVVAPPSVHPTGHVYRWTELDGPEGELAGADEPLCDLPPWLVALVAGPGDRSADAAGITSAGTGDRYGQAALEAECGRVAIAPEGQRNDTVNRAGFRLGQLVAEGRLEARQVAEALLVVARRVGLTENEAVATIRSGMAKGMSQGRRRIA